MSYDEQSDRAWQIVRELKTHRDPSRLVTTLGDGNNAHPLVHAMVKNNLQHAGPLLFSAPKRGEALRKAVGVSPLEVIRTLKAARLRGRGGAGFPAGMKLEFARAAPGKFLGQQQNTTPHGAPRPGVRRTHHSGLRHWGFRGHRLSPR